MHKAPHLIEDVVRLFVSREDGARGLASIQYSIDASIQKLEDYVKKPGEGLITDPRNNTDNTSINRKKSENKNCKENNSMYISGDK